MISLRALLCTVAVCVTGGSTGVDAAKLRGRDLAKAARDLANTAKDFETTVEEAGKHSSLKLLVHIAYRAYEGVSKCSFRNGLWGGEDERKAAVGNLAVLGTAAAQKPQTWFYFTAISCLAKFTIMPCVIKPVWFCIRNCFGIPALTRWISGKCGSTSSSNASAPATGFPASVSAAVPAAAGLFGEASPQAAVPAAPAAPAAAPLSSASPAAPAAATSSVSPAGGKGPGAEETKKTTGGASKKTSSTSWIFAAIGGVIALLVVGGIVLAMRSGNPQYQAKEAPRFSGDIEPADVECASVPHPETAASSAEVAGRSSLSSAFDSSAESNFEDSC